MLKSFSDLLRPSNVKHLQIVLNNPNFLLLMGLIEVFQNNSYVHVDNNHVADNNERSKVGDGKQWASAIAMVSGSGWISQFAGGWLNHERFQNIVPSR